MGDARYARSGSAWAGGTVQRPRQGGLQHMRRTHSCKHSCRPEERDSAPRRRSPMLVLLPMLLPVLPVPVLLPVPALLRCVLLLQRVQVALL